MTQPHSIMKTLLLGLGSALLATACTITLDPDGIGGDEGGDDAQCLELFETCVELAGDSPGCEALFEFCSSGEGGDEGGVEPPPGCEGDYINCLAEGVDPEACEPLLWECEPGGDDGGMCDADDPDCQPPEPPACDEADDPNCQPPDCDQVYENCVAETGEEEACQDLLPGCWDDNCDAMLNDCEAVGGDPDLCQEMTGCYPEPPPDDCQQLLNECYDQGAEGNGDPDGNGVDCQALYPECFDEPQPDNCDWYYGECHEQFDDAFCEQGANDCESGQLPGQVDCGVIFPDACATVDITDAACSNAEQSCWNGFEDADLCGVEISDNTDAWLLDLVECNGWNEG